MKIEPSEVVDAMIRQEKQDREGALIDDLMEDEPKGCRRALFGGMVVSLMAVTLIVTMGG